LESFVAGQFFQRFVSYLMYIFWFISSLCFDKLFLHVVENTSLTYAKFSCSFFMIDSCFSHVMTPWTIIGPPKVYIFLSNFLILGTLNKREVLDKMVKLTRCKLNLEPKNSGIFSRLQHQKNQAVTLMNSELCIFTAYVLDLQYALSFMVQVKYLPCPSWYK
jgi:hypothetical protein